MILLKSNPSIIVTFVLFLNIKAIIEVFLTQKLNLLEFQWVIFHFFFHHLVLFLLINQIII